MKMAIDTSGKHTTTPAENRLVLSHLYVAFGALFVGTTFGLLQTLARANLMQPPPWFDYYRMLTAHGVLLALVFTTFFITGLATFSVYKTIARERRPLNVGWIAWIVMLAGTLMAAFEILTGGASVLYTFYAPLKASPWFYIGATLLIVGTWIVFLDILLNLKAFRKDNPGTAIPLPAFMAAATFVMWFLATLGVAIEMLLLIPWAFGWTSGIDVLLTRMLFWYFGHPLVYFWILGAYIVWYAVVPALLKVPVFSDALTRLAFVLFLVLSLPIGLHHEFVDPGIAARWKLLQTFLTLMVVVPSLMTAFAIFATFEESAAAKGQRGFVNIVRSLPWSDPVFAGIVLAMILFIFGGFGGIVNASYAMDILVHNTMWIVGHFHVTVGGPVALTFLAVSYLLVPALTGRKLWSRSLALVQVWLWFVGMSIMSIAMHTQGLLGAPRRSADIAYAGAAVAAQWHPWALVTAAGGVVILTSVVAFAINLFATIFAGEEGETPFVFAAARADEPPAPKWVGNLGMWTVVAVLLVVVAYGGAFYDHFREHVYLIPGLRTW